MDPDPGFSKGALNLGPSKLGDEQGKSKRGMNSVGYPARATTRFGTMPRPGTWGFPHVTF